MRPLLFVVVVTLIVSPCLAGTAEPVTIPGTHVSMTPPSGWTASDTFSGFQEKATGSSILVNEMEGAPYSKTTAGFTKEQMATRGMALISKDPAVFGAHKGMLLTVKQTSRGEPYGKWIACFGNESRTVMVVASVKQAVVARLKDSVVASLMTAHIGTGAAVDPLAGLLFEVQAKEPYRLAKRVSSTVIFTHRGEFPTSSPTAPLFVVGSSLGGPPPSDHQAFAKERVQRTESLTDISIYNTGPATIDGITGVDLAATATDKATKTPMVVYQVMLFDKDIYYIMQGIASQKDGVEAPIWLEMVKSFKRKLTVSKSK